MAGPTTHRVFLKGEKKARTPQAEPGRNPVLRAGRTPSAGNPHVRVVIGFSRLRERSGNHMRAHADDLSVWGNIEMHPIGRTEACLAEPSENEAHALVEITRVTICCHLDARHASFSCAGDRVAHKRPTNPAPHPVWIDEQVIELADTLCDQHRCEPDDSIFDDGYSNPLLHHSSV